MDATERTFHNCHELEIPSGRASLLGTFGSLREISWWLPVSLQGLPGHLLEPSERLLGASGSLLGPLEGFMGSLGASRAVQGRPGPFMLAQVGSNLTPSWPQNGPKLAPS